MNTVNEISKKNLNTVLFYRHSKIKFGQKYTLKQKKKTIIVIILKLKNIIDGYLRLRIHYYTVFSIEKIT